MIKISLYNDLEDVKLNLNDIFYSIQGEGMYIGIPTLFFRFNRCIISPKCDYCDTKFEECKIDNVPSMMALVKNFFENYPIRHICFTGGEPLLFKEQINLILSIIYEKLQYTEFDIKIETTGLINFPYIYPYRRRLIYTITPKFKYINDYTSDNFNISRSDTIFKFMMELNEYKFSKQLDQIMLFLTNNNLHDCDFYFAPINRDDNILDNYKQIVRNMNKYNNHILFKSKYIHSFKGVTIQLNKLLEWK